MLQIFTLILNLVFLLHFLVIGCLAVFFLVMKIVSKKLKIHLNEIESSMSCNFVSPWGIKTAKIVSNGRNIGVPFDMIGVLLANSFFYILFQQKIIQGNQAKMTYIEICTINKI